jgi:PBP1b-binding outer membrane lipoprotein LpoB
MKRLLLAMSAACLLSGCVVEYDNKTPCSKGKVVDKEFVAAQKIPAKCNCPVKTFTPELYIVTIEGTMTVAGRYGEVSRTIKSVYLVSPSIFAELEIGREIDFSGNVDAKIAVLE